MKAKRASLTQRERNDMFDAQGGMCFCGCGEPLGSDFIGEHWAPVALGNANKPDCLLRRDCADRKTNGLRGDISTIAKVKRIRNARTQYDKRLERGSRIKSRDFTHWRGMDGTIRSKGQ